MPIPRQVVGGLEADFGRPEWALAVRMSSGASSGSVVRDPIAMGVASDGRGKVRVDLARHRLLHANARLLCHFNLFYKIYTLP